MVVELASCRLLRHGSNIGLGLAVNKKRPISKNDTIIGNAMEAVQSVEDSIAVLRYGSSPKLWKSGRHQSVMKRCNGHLDLIVRQRPSAISGSHAQ